jgi:hypothetical protein
MKLLVSTLSFLFSALETMAAVLIFPLTLLCAVGVIGFTIKIARDMKAKGLPSGPLFEADRLHA